MANRSWYECFVDDGPARRTISFQKFSPILRNMTARREQPDFGPAPGILAGAPGAESGSSIFRICGAAAKKDEVISRMGRRCICRHDPGRRIPTVFWGEKRFEKGEGF